MGDLGGAVLPSAGSGSTAIAGRMGTGGQFARPLRRDPILHDIRGDGGDEHIVGAALRFGR